MVTTTQDQGHHIQGLAQGPALNLPLDPIPYPQHTQDQGHARVQARGVDPVQEAEAVQGDGALRHGVDPVHDLKRGEDPDLDPVALITPDTKGHVAHLLFLLGNVMLEVGITLNQAIV